jgi:hypothetical protein
LLEHGLTTKCMEKDSLHGQMVEVMTESTKMIRNRVLEFSHGQMEENM